MATGGIFPVGLALIGDLVPIKDRQVALGRWLIVIIPIAKKPEEKQRVFDYCRALKKDLEAQSFAGSPIRARSSSR